MSEETAGADTYTTIEKEIKIQQEQIDQNENKGFYVKIFLF